jgi:hypothetical protein
MLVSRALDCLPATLCGIRKSRLAPYSQLSIAKGHGWRKHAMTVLLLGPKSKAPGRAGKLLVSGSFRKANSAASV